MPKFPGGPDTSAVTPDNNSGSYVRASSVPSTGFGLQASLPKQNLTLVSSAPQDERMNGSARRGHPGPIWGPACPSPRPESLRDISEFSRPVRHPGNPQAPHLHAQQVLG